MRISSYLFIFLIAGCSCPTANTNHRLYQFYDMEESLQDHYTNDLGKINPGLACGDFKNNNDIGCFKLLVQAVDHKVTKMIYQELSTGGMLELYEFNPPADDVFIEKIYDSTLKTSNALPEHEEITLATGQPSLRLVYFGKSAVVFYWKNGTFHPIWTAD